MKTLLLSGIILLSLTTVSCKKEAIVQGQNNSYKLNNKQLKFIENLKSIDTPSSEERSNVSPENPNNPFDSYAIYFYDLIVNMNSSEELNPSMDSSTYSGRISEYFDQNSYGFSFSNLSINDTLFFASIAQIIIDAGLQEKSNKAIYDLKIIEDSISGNNYYLLDSDETAFLLNLSSALKYSRSSIAENGVIIGDTTIDPEALSTPCFDYQFEQGTYNVLSTLTDWDNPGAAISGWLGLPGMIGGAIGNGLYYALTKC